MPNFNPAYDTRLTSGGRSPLLDGTLKQPGLPGAGAGLEFTTGILQPQYGRRTRGQIIRQAGAGNNGADADAFQFLFNPSTVTTRYDINNAIYDNSALGDGGDNPNAAAGIASSTSIGFSIFVDRMYEVASADGSDVSQRGAMVDIEQLEKITGFTEGSPFLVRNPVYLTLGGPQGWYGYISGFSTQVLLWSKDMIPTRVAISDLTLVQQPLPSAATRSQLLQGVSDGAVIGVFDTAGASAGAAGAGTVLSGADALRTLTGAAAVVSSANPSINPSNQGTIFGQLAVQQSSSSDTHHRGGFQP